MADPIASARALFLRDDNRFGCAESAYLALAEAFGFDGLDSAPAMALNGGIAYSGGTCGAITGTALVIGMLAERRLEDHQRAKRFARETVADAMDRFEAKEGAVTCRALLGLDLRAPGAHEAFIAAGAWRTSCLRRIELALDLLAPLAEATEWELRVADVESRAGIERGTVRA